MTKHILSRLLALVIFFFYTGGIILLWFTEAMRDFETFKREPLLLICFTIWGLLATAFGVFLWNDKGRTL